MKTAIAAGEPVSLPKTGSIADGLLTIRAGDVTFAHAREFVDEFVTVPDAAIAEAVAWLFRHARLVVEPSGAATTAAVMLGLGRHEGRKGRGRDGQRRQRRARGVREVRRASA